MGAGERNNPFHKWKKDEGVVNTRAYDLRGREVRVGDLVYLDGVFGIQWRVVGVKPIMHPQAQPGLVELSLAAGKILGVPGGKALQDVIKIGDAEELSPLPQAPDGDAATPQDPAAGGPKLVVQ